MMKKLLLLFLLIVSIKCLPQEIANKFPINSNGDIELTEVIESPLKKDALFSNAQEWVAKTYGDYKSVVQFEDRENGKLIMKGISDNQYVFKDDLSLKREIISYTITIDCKENKYRYKLEDLSATITTRMLGTSFDGTSESPNIRLEDINEAQKRCLSIRSEIEKQEALYKESKNKKTSKSIKKLKEELVLKEAWLTEKINFYNGEYEAITHVIESLKYSMSIDDSF